MKIFLSRLFPVILILGLSSGCNTSDSMDDRGLTGNSQGYALEEKNDSGISGSIRFEEFHGGDTFVTMQLGGVDFDETYELRLHDNTVEEGGPMMLELGEIFGLTGTNDAIIDAEDNRLSYDDLIEYNGHVLVHISGNNDTPVAAGDIGSNAD